MTEPERAYYANIAKVAFMSTSGTPHDAWLAVAEAVRGAPPYVDPALKMAQELRLVYEAAREDGITDLWLAVGVAAVARGAR